jgi:mRNA interferase MazF
VAAITRTVPGLVSELELTVTDDGVPTDCVVNFENIHAIPRDTSGMPTHARRHRMLRRLQLVQ